MKSISDTELRAQCPALLDHLPQEGVVIARDGRPIARLLPIRPASADLNGALRGRLRIRGGILSTGAWGSGRQA